jgi:hypothetical protein
MPTACLLARRDMNIQRLIVRTALGCHLRSCRSVQRFERDTYHGDALPTELRGRGFRLSDLGFRSYGPSSQVVHSGGTASNLAL